MFGFYPVHPVNPVQKTLGHRLIARIRRTPLLGFVQQYRTLVDILYPFVLLYMQVGLENSGRRWASGNAGGPSHFMEKPSIPNPWFPRPGYVAISSPKCHKHDLAGRAVIP